MVKALLKSGLCAAYKYSGAARLAEACTAPGRRAAILLFHRVTDEIPEGGITVGTRRFRGICRMLRRAFRVVPLAEVFRLARSGQAMPARTVAITFDDCYYNNLAAGHVLAEYGLPAAFFVPAGIVGTTLVFPWDQGLPHQRNLSWDDVRQLADMGFEIGSHTVTHPNLAAVSRDQARREIIDSKQIIEERLARPVRWFAYPFGEQEHFPDDLLPVVAEAGYEGCLSGYGGFVTAGQSGLMLRRLPVPMPTFQCPLHLELYLRGALAWFYLLRPRPDVKQS